MNDQAPTTETPEIADTAEAALAEEAVKESTSYDVEFEGHTYTVLDGQPSPKAMEYIADYVDRSNGIFAVLFVREMIGQAEWDEWCKRHQTSEIRDMLLALNKGFSGNS